MDKTNDIDLIKQMKEFLEKTTVVGDHNFINLLAIIWLDTTVVDKCWEHVAPMISWNHSNSQMY